MPKFLNTEGNASLAIFICDRCKMKRPISEAQADPNFHGLRVCQQGCADQVDPYRLPARKTEKITVRFPRPDTNIDVDKNDISISTYQGQIAVDANHPGSILIPSSKN